MLLLDDGRIVLDVDRGARQRGARRSCATAAMLSNNKGINRQGGGLTAPALTAKDMEDIKTAAKLQADFLAVSFPKRGADMNMARELLRAAGGTGHADRQDRARRGDPDALNDILEASDGIMVARGDLAVEVGDAAVPALQKRMIRLAREHEQARDHRDADDGVDDRRARCRRAPRSPTSPTRCSTAPTR